MRDFRKLEIWHNGIIVVKEVYSLTEKFPDKEKFGISSQMQRCSVSIPSNIAEGCSRNSETEYKRFLEIAIGSAFELETQLIICSELGYVKQEDYQNISKKLNTLQKQINALITMIVKVQKSTSKSQRSKIWLSNNSENTSLVLLPNGAGPLTRRLQYIFPLLFIKRICNVYDEEVDKALIKSDGYMEYADAKEISDEDKNAIR